MCKYALRALLLKVACADYKFAVNEYRYGRKLKKAVPLLIVVFISTHLGSTVRTIAVSPDQMD